MITYLFDCTVRGLVDAETKEQAIKILQHTTIWTPHVFIDDMEDIVVQEFPAREPKEDTK